MDTTLLEKIGLTTGEVRVYLALLELGSSSTGAIIDKSQITSSKVYVILERLEKKGLVSHLIQNGVKQFQVADPKRLLDYMQEKKNELENETLELNKLIPELKKKHKLLYEIQETTMFKGSKGFQSARDDFLSDLKKGDEYVVFGSQQPIQKLFKNTIKRFHFDNENRGIKTKLIYNSRFRKVKELYKEFPNTKVRFIEHILPSSIAISKSKVLLIAYGEDPIQVLIKNKGLAKSHWDFFKSMWEIATP